jgi:ABC-type multidrug transport system ATPase subunit
METMLSATSLSKSFKHFKAVDNISFSINKGEVYGFLGQNGAGKSTTMRLLLGLIFPDAGSVHISGQLLGKNKRHLLKNVGAIIERPDLYSYLSGWDNLKIFATLSDVNIKNNRLQEVFEIVGLRGRENDLVNSYSQGMKQRLGLAIAIVHNPNILILDEPTNGLDPQGIADMRALIRTLNADHKKTILISSHLIYEIQQVASSMLIIHKGKKLIEGHVQQLLNVNDTITNFQIQSNQSILTALSISSWTPYLLSSTSETLSFKMDPEKIPQLNKWLVDNNIAVKSINSMHSLEQYFLNMTHDSTAKN